MTYPNWFETNGAKQNFEFFLEGMKDAPVTMLQVGAFTGDASKWLLEHVLTNPDSVLVDVDTWGGSDEEAHEKLDFSEVEKIYDEKVSNFKNIRKYKMTSEEFFDKNDRIYDFIYIDGSHTALDVFNDGISAWDCLNEGGIIAFDDYTWDGGKGDFLNPRDGIDGVFVTHMKDMVILHCGTQAWFQKITKKPMLIEGIL